MPKVKWCKPIPPPNLLRDLFDRNIKAKKITSTELGKRLHLQPESVRRKKSCGTWTAEEIRAWCLALGINDPMEVGCAVLNRVPPEK